MKIHDAAAIGNPEQNRVGFRNESSDSATLETPIMKNKRQRYSSDATNATSAEKTTVKTKFDEVKIELPLISFDRNFNYEYDSIEEN
mmetsp:Transcript_11177/g.12602  ORF Transcript_11177/g.12602 Transcript_11177/m.12602 type:complete len:87 (-) Transcript_11177:230-490(-)